jgi:hypothetical protein
MRHAEHEDRREDELSCGESEKSTVSRSSKEESVFDDTQSSVNSSRVVLVIVALALVFIAIMTYFVGQMPRKP